MPIGVDEERHKAGEMERDFVRNPCRAHASDGEGPVALNPGCETIGHFADARLSGVHHLLP